MSTAVATKETKPSATLRQQLASDYFKQQVSLALPKHMTPDRFIRVGLTALMKTPKLLECTQESVLQCMLACSTLGLEPDGRRAHLIPYGTTCTLIVDYKGIVELAKRSGDVSNVFAQIVCENDSFEWETGKLTHRIDFKRERGTMYAAYAVITFKDGTIQSDVMTKSEIDAIRKRSRSGNSGPWVTDYNEMAKKTVFRRASKWITLSPEIADAFDKEDEGSHPAPTVTSDLSPERLFGSATAALDKPTDADQIPGAEIEVTADKAPAGATTTGTAEPTKSATELFPGGDSKITPADHLAALKVKITDSGTITEGDIIAYMAAVKLITDDSLTTLFQVNTVAPFAIEAVVKTWADAEKKIKKAKAK